MNKYCNLEGNKPIKDEYGKINTGFDNVDVDVQGLQTQINTTFSEIDTRIDAVELKNIQQDTVIDEKLNKTDGVLGTSSEIVDTANLVLLRNSISGRLTLTIEGNTLKNELVYNPSTWAEWAKSAGVVGDITGLELTADGVNWRTISITANVKPSTKYGYLYNVVSSTLTGTFICGGGTTNYQTLPKNIGNNKFIVTTNASVSGNIGFQFGTQTEPSGNKIKLKEIRVFELPAGSQIEADFANATTQAQIDALAVKYPFAPGIKSVGEDEGGVGVHKIEILSVGKNLFDGQLESGVYSTVTGSKTPNSSYIRSKNQNIRIKPNTKYTLSRNFTGEVVVMYYDINKNYLNINNNTANQNIIFTTPVNAYYINFYMLGTNINALVQLEENDVSSPYEINKQDKISLSLTQPHRGLPNGTKDIISTDGVLTKKVGKGVYDGSADENWSLANGALTNTIAFGIVAPCKDYSYTICDKFPFASGNEDFEHTRGSTSMILIYVQKTRLATQDLAGFKIWLAANPVTVLYELATPTTETLATKPNVKCFKNGSLQITSLIPPYLTILYPQLLQNGATMQVLFGTFASRPTAPTTTTMYVASDKVAGNADRLTMWDNTSKTWLQI